MNSAISLFIDHMKKKILFVIPEYSHGGTNKSLENLLHFIDKDRYDVSIYSLYEDGGPLYKDIFAPYVVKKSLLYHLAHDNKLTRKIMGLAMKLSSMVNFDWLYKTEANRLQNKYSFDTIIAFQEGTATEFVSFVKNCTNKVAWIHCDYGARWKDSNGKDETKEYDKFNYIVCVSHASTDSFLSIYPQNKKKTKCLYNTINTEIIEKLSESFTVDFDIDCFNIVSVGRFVQVKQFHIIPDIVAEIRKLTNKKFCWYIIGDGEKKTLTMSKINELGLTDYVKCIGAVDNPYPYFKAADLHVCTSGSESFSYTIAESKLLHTPVLSNDFPVAYEVIDDQVGWIRNVNDMAPLIAGLINDNDCIYSCVKKTILDYEYDNCGARSAICKLLNKPVQRGDQ